MRVGKAVIFNPINPLGQERRRLKVLLEDTIKTMYLHASGDEAIGALTPERKIGSMLKVRMLSKINHIFNL